MEPPQRPAPGRAAALALLILALLAVAPAAAVAAPAAPRPRTPPPGAVAPAIPPLGWAPVTDAVEYEVEVATDPSFDGPVFGGGERRFTTRNTSATMLEAVANGTYWWRVRAIGRGRVPSRWSAPRSIVKRWTTRATPVAPAAGAAVAAPAAVTLRWTPVAGAATYDVYVGTDPALGTLLSRDGEAWNTEATALTIPAHLAPGTYYWAVTPLDAGGNPSVRSEVRPFVRTWASGTPTRVVDLVPADSMYDPQFSWAPVPGAVRYEVEVNSSRDFPAGSRTCCRDTTLNTSLSPAVTFAANRNYWRVRALDAGGNPGRWNAGAPFDKLFDRDPDGGGPATSIEGLRIRDHRADAPSDLDAGSAGYQTSVPVVVWNPVLGASAYRVEVAPLDAGVCNWNAATTRRWNSLTATPGWTPLGKTSIKPPYRPELGASKDGAVLQDGGRYCVRVRARAGNDTARTPVTGDYTYLADPTGLADGAAFTYVEATPGACEAAGGLCAPGDADYLTPARGATRALTPLLTWNATPGAAAYWVVVATDANFQNVVDIGFTRVPAYAPRRATDVRAYPDEDTSFYWAALPARSADGQLPMANDPRLVATSRFLKRSEQPQTLLPAAGQAVTGQPVFRWTPTHGALSYTLEVASDPAFGNVVLTATSASTGFSAPGALPADTRLHWRVRANDAQGQGLRWSVVGHFRKVNAAPSVAATNAPAGRELPTWLWGHVQGTASYDIQVIEPDGDTAITAGVPTPAVTPVRMTGTGLFQWRVRAAFPRGAGTTTEPGPWSPMQRFARSVGQPTDVRLRTGGGSTVLSWAPVSGVDAYRVQVSEDADFDTVFESVTTDLTAWASPMTRGPYRKGGRFHVRVAGMDADGNLGEWSTARQVRVPLLLGVRAAGLVRVRRPSRVVVTVTDPRGVPVAGAVVRIAGPGLRARPRRTDRRGVARFTVRTPRPGLLVVRAGRSGFQAGEATLRAR